MTPASPAVTGFGLGFGFQRQMARADFAAFRRWPDARCLLVATAEERAGTFTSPTETPAETPAEPQSLAEAA